MFEFKFALVWLGFMTVFTGLLLGSGGIGAFIAGSFVIIPFWIIGIYLLKRGIDKISIDRQTDNFGESCYGLITDIYPSGSYANNIPELKANVTIYIPSSHEIMDVSEILGMADKVGVYRVGSYVQLRYFEGDINFEFVLDEESLPIDVKEQLSASDSLVTAKNTNNIISNDTVVIDGVEYVRSDRINNINKY